MALLARATIPGFVLGVTPTSPAYGQAQQSENLDEMVFAADLPSDVKEAAEKVRLKAAAEKKKKDKRLAAIRNERGTVADPMATTIRTKAGDADAVELALDDLDQFLLSKRKMSEESASSILTDEATAEISADFVERVSGGCYNAIMAADPFRAMIINGEYYNIKQSDRLAYMITCRAIWKGYLIAAWRAEAPAS